MILLRFSRPGLSNQRLPHCFRGTASTFVNYICTKKVTQSCRKLGVPLIVIFTHVAREPQHNSYCEILPKWFVTTYLNKYRDSMSN